MEYEKNSLMLIKRINNELINLIYSMKHRYEILI